MRSTPALWRSRSTRTFIKSTIIDMVVSWSKNLLWWTVEHSKKISPLELLLMLSFYDVSKFKDHAYPLIHGEVEQDTCLYAYKKFWGSILFRNKFFYINVNLENFPVVDFEFLYLLKLQTSNCYNLNYDFFIEFIIYNNQALVESIGTLKGFVF